MVLLLEVLDGIILSLVFGNSCRMEMVLDCVNHQDRGDP